VLADGPGTGHRPLGQTAGWPGGGTLYPRCEKGQKHLTPTPEANKYATLQRSYAKSPTVRGFQGRGAVNAYGIRIARQGR